jgi:hypothetical protein
MSSAGGWGCRPCLDVPRRPKEAMTGFADEIARRRTFAIISNPDAGKTALTEKLLLFAGAILWCARYNLWLWRYYYRVIYLGIGAWLRATCESVSVFCFEPVLEPK